MKTTLLLALGFTSMAFTSFGQHRSTGIPQQTFNTTVPQQITYQEAVSSRTQPSRPSNTLINRAPCVDTLLYEDFQSKTIPATWQNLDLDGANDANFRPANWFVPFDPQSTVPGDTNWVAGASSWFSPAGVANNVLIMDAIQPCASTILQWKSAPFEGPAFMDGYKVKISTTGTNITDFTTTLFTAAESLNGTTTPSAGTVHTSYNGNNGILQQWTVNLGAYDNQTVYIAFFHDSNDDNLIQVDDIFIGTIDDFNMSVISTSTERFYSTPLSQVSPRTFTSNLTVAQTQSVTNPTASFEVFQGATSVFTNNQSAATLAPGNIISLTSTGFTPAAIADYTTVITASALETDPILSNNVDSVFFVVSDSVFSTENGIINGALSIGAGNTGFLGNQYTLVASDDITSLTFTLTAPTLGDTIVGAVYSMVAGTPSTIIALTDTLIITSIAQAEYTLPIVGGSANLVAGDYTVGLMESLSGALTLGTNTEYYAPGTAWVFFGGNWDNNESFGFPNTYLMHANFGPACAEPGAAYTESTTDLSVTFTDASTDTDSWLWDFGDGNTSTLQNPTHTYAVAGTYTACLIALNNCGGDTICMPITVTICSNPVANYTSSVTAGTVNFTNTSTSSLNATYAWDFGDGQTSTLENPTNVYTAIGNYTACLTITDSCGVDSVCTTVSVSTLGIAENSLIDQLSIFPVPAQNQMSVSNLTYGEDFKLELLNNLGQVVKVIRTEGLESIQLDLSGIVDGYYHLRISNSTVIGTRVVMIKH